MQRFNDAIEEIFKNYYKSNDNMKAVLEKSRKRQAVIFGAGELGHRMYHILKEYGISVKCFCDNLVSGRTDSRMITQVMLLFINNCWILVLKAVN